MSTLFFQRTCSRMANVVSSHEGHRLSNYARDSANVIKTNLKFEKKIVTAGDKYGARWYIKIKMSNKGLFLTYFVD